MTKVKYDIYKNNDKITLNALDIKNERESCQEDIGCILDGIDCDILDKVCDIIVERFDNLIEKGLRN